MIILLIGVLSLILLLNIAYYEYRLSKKEAEIDLLQRYCEMLLVRRYK
jgi:hypothetical protein